MKSNRVLIYEYIKECFAKGIHAVDTRSVSNALNIQRTNVSAQLNQLVREGKITKTNTRPVYYSLTVESQTDPFETLIGYDGSLSNAIKLAKAALHYPHKSLTTLVVGEEGVGKIKFANAMFEYAKNHKLIDFDEKMITINCRHYENNQEKLTEYLFGKNEDKKKKNYLESDDHNFVFIDNIHLLDGMNMSRLLHFLDHRFITYSDNTKSDFIDTTLILTINKASQSKLSTLESKIPILINLPNLEERPLKERFDLINRIFLDEAKNTNYDLNIDKEVLYSLMLVEDAKNIRYLSGSIKVAVAHAYLRSYDQMIDYIQVSLFDFDEKIQDAYLKFRLKKEEVLQAIPPNFDFKFKKDSEAASLKIPYRDFYEYIDEKLALAANNNEAEVLIEREMTRLIEDFKKEFKDYDTDLNQLSKVVDEKIPKLVIEFLKEHEELSFTNSLIYGLSLHINALVNNKEIRHKLNLEKIDEIKQNYQKEYELAKELAEKIEEIFKVKLSEDQNYILSMFLIQDEPTDVAAYPQIILAMHGHQSASSITDVIQTLIKNDNIYGFDMPLDKKSEDIYDDLKQLVLDTDTGKGIIMIYDMGSFKLMAEKIANETNIDIRLLYLPLTLVGLEASRKASIEPDIDTVYHNLLHGLKRELSYVETNNTAIIALCHTGEGGAKEIQSYLYKNYRDDIKIYAFAQSDRKALAKEVQKIKQFYDVKAFVGTFDPKIYGIPFIPVSRIFELEKEGLDALLLSNLEEKSLNYNQMIEYLHEESGIDKTMLDHTLPDVVEHLDIVYGLNIDQKVGLFLHIGSLIHRIQEKAPLSKIENVEWYFKFKKPELNSIQNVLKKVENAFDIIIPDSELVNIYEIVNTEEKDGS